MFESDLQRLPGELATVLTVRGLSLPALRWAQTTYDRGKETLERLSDDALFKPHAIKDAKQALAARALLYYYCGHAGKALSLATNAPKGECGFIQGIARRALGDPNGAKTGFQAASEHPVYRTLFLFARRLIADNACAPVKRFRDTLSFNKAWEPFAFIDLYEQAVAGQIDAAGEQIIRQLLTQEFKQIFKHCYIAATGHDFTAVSEDERASQAEEQAAKRRMAATKKLHEPSRVHRTADANPSKPAATPTPSREIRVGCPRCKHVNTAGESDRGRQIRCEHCGVNFVVPAGKGKITLPATPSNMIKIACPKCRDVADYPVTARGKKVRCHKCSVVFAISPGKTRAG